MPPDGQASFAGLECSAVVVQVGPLVPNHWGSAPLYPIAEEAAVLSLAGPAEVEVELPELASVRVQTRTSAGEAFPRGYAILGGGADGRSWPLVTGADGVVSVTLPVGKRLLNVTDACRSALATVDGHAVELPAAVQVGPGGLSVELRCGEATPISARIVDVDGNPIGGRIIEAFLAQGDASPAWSGVTYHDGRIVGAVPVRPPFILVPRDLEQRYRFIPPNLTVTDGLDTELEFLGVNVERETITGRVVDATSREPVPGVTVQARMTTELEGGDGFVEVQTDAAGAFELPCVEDGWLEVTASRAMFREPARWQGSAGDCSVTLELELPSEASVEGRVLASGKKPVAGLALGARGLDGGGRSRGATDEQGRFAFAGLAAGRWAFELLGTPAMSEEGAKGPWVLAWRSSEEEGYERVVVDLEEAEEEVLELELIEAGALCATVTTEGGERPDLDVLQVFRPGRDEPLARVKAGKAARSPELCSEPLIPGRYQVLVGDAGSEFLPLWWQNAEARPDALDVDVQVGTTVTLPFIVRPAGSVTVSVGGVRRADMESFHLQVARAPMGKDAQLHWDAVPEGRFRVSWKSLKALETAEPEAGVDITLRVQLPVGSWLLRTCDIDDCSGRRWDAEKPVKVLQGGRHTASLEVASDRAARATPPQGGAQ